MSLKIVIIDYEMGNHFSIQKKLSRLGFEVKVSNSSADIKKADKLILPGVGHFGKAMDNLRRLNLIDILNEVVLVDRKNILGICLGMQIMAKHSEEGDSEGLGWIDAEVIKFKIENSLYFKVPHVGWNGITAAKDSKLLKNIPDNSEFYFVHSYHFSKVMKENILCFSDYEKKFVSAIEKDNIFGVQFHPEKSHSIGNQLFANFYNL
jgi:glutamine amidotransferase